jgi:hypothetical protein
MTDTPPTDTLPLFTEGIMADGAAILMDGVPVPIEDVVAMLNNGVYYKNGLECALRHQQMVCAPGMAQFSTTVHIITKALVGMPR